MSTHRLSLSSAMSLGPGVDRDAFARLFHELIRTDALGEPLVDVVDYSHMVGGPSVLLVGHASDYFVRLVGTTEVGYQRKRVGEAPFEAHLTDSFHRFFGFLRALRGLDLEIPTSKVRVAFLDRLRMPNTEAAYEIARASLLKVGADLFEGPSVARELHDAREPLRAVISGRPRLETARRS